MTDKELVLVQYPNAVAVQRQDLHYHQQWMILSAQVNGTILGGGDNEVAAWTDAEFKINGS